MCLEWLKSLFGSSGSEKPSPSDIVPRDSIVQTDGYFIIDLNRLNIPFTKLPKTWIPEIPDTNSMDGAFDYGNNNLLIAGADEENQRILINFLKVGDVAVYQVSDSPITIHRIVDRIVEIGTDKQGRYFIFKGDNNAKKDPYIVRDADIKWLSIGVIY